MGEVFRVRDVDYVAQFPDHVVSLFLRGSVDLLQRRNGRTTQRTMHAGDIIFTPAGEPKLLRHREEAEIIKLRIAPSFLEGVIEDMDGTPHGSIELLDNFGTRDGHLEALARRVLSEIRAADFASRIYVESLANHSSFTCCGTIRLRERSMTPPLADCLATNWLEPSSLSTIIFAKT